MSILGSIAKSMLDSIARSNVSHLGEIERRAKQEGKTLKPEFYETQERAKEMLQKTQEATKRRQQITDE